MKEKVLIIFGGKSVEHDISIITALQATKCLPEEYSFLPVYIDRKGLWWTADNLSDLKVYSDFERLAKKKKQVSLVVGENKILLKKGNKFCQSIEVKAVLNCCHGNIGEDGALQGVFKACDIPQSSCGVTSSALCMDKAFMKDVLKANNIVSPEYVCLRKCAYEQKSEKSCQEITEKLGFPVVVKPANLGSSIGISVCKDYKSLTKGIELALGFDEKVLVEKMVENLQEFNCACFKYKGQYFVSNVNEVTNKSEIYTFEDKYLSSATKTQTADRSLAKKIEHLTQKTYQLFDCKGVVRVDFLYDNKSKVLYVNEINSIPGSLAFYLFKGISFKDLLVSLIEEALYEYDAEKSLIKTFESDALNIFENSATAIKK